MSEEEPLRPNLGDFNSIVCFKAAVVGIEETMGPQAAKVALTAAGRKRGHALVESLGLTGKGADLQVASARLAAALGIDGTRLCTIERIDTDGEVIRVIVSDTVCMAGEPQGSTRECSFTLGAVHGALEALTGRKLSGKHVESRWRGDPEDVFQFRDRF